MERLAMDILGPLSQTPRGNRFVLVVTDYFSKWTESYAVPNQEAVTVAEKLVSEFVCRFGVPREIHSDQGINFESKVMAEVCKLLDIEKTKTTPLHPRSDGQRLAGAHEVVRRHLGRAAERLKRNYDKRVSNKPYRVGDSVCFHNIRRKKGRNPKLDFPWEGPYLVVTVLSDVTYRIQKSRRAKPKVIHADRLKPYLGPALKSWISDKEETVTPVESQVVSAGEDEPVTGGSVSAVSREGESDGSAAMECLDPVICSSPQEAEAMSDDAESDVGSSETEEVAATDADAEIPPHAMPAMLLADNRTRRRTARPLWVDTPHRMYGVVMGKSGDNRIVMVTGCSPFTCIDIGQLM
ncbi:hypothetical protein ACROYT_G026010 [Oculina patagonica]